MSINEELIKILKERNLTITTMESCTGGALISSITDVEGVSAVTDGGYVTYSNKAKMELGISPETIAKYGVYSFEMAKEMSELCRDLRKSDIGVGITGSLNNVDINNKDSVSCEVYFAISYNNKIFNTEKKSNIFLCDIKVPKMERNLQKQYIVNIILEKLLEILKGKLC